WPEEHLAVLLIREHAKARVRPEVGRRPLPDVADHVLDAVRAGARRVRPERRGPRRPVTEVRPAGCRRGGSPREAPGPPGLRVPRARLLPLGFRRQPPARPAGVRLRLVPADVLHRLVHRQRLVAAEAPADPRPAVAAPELGCRQALAVAPLP